MYIYIYIYIYIYSRNVWHFEFNEFPCGTIHL